MAHLPLTLVFGEDANDREAIREIIGALCPNKTVVRAVRKPIILVRDRQQRAVQNLSQKIASVVVAHEVKERVGLVVAHQDCDACEPAHMELAGRIERELGHCGKPVVAATPAWEIEAWWYLWPDAVACVSPKWRRLRRGGANVGMIKDVKEALRRDLRPSDHSIKSRDYLESDSVNIARNVRQLGIIDTRNAQSQSFDSFATKIRNIYS